MVSPYNGDGPMLVLIESEKEKRKWQAHLQRSIENALKSQGKMNIGYPGGQTSTVVYSNGEGQLWFGADELDAAKVPRFWNAFGIFHPEYGNQMISVEINIPIENNS